MLKSLMEKLTEIQNMKEDREVTTHIGKYGTEYQGDEDDEDDDGEPKKKAAPAGEKRGRGRPRKDADNTGHVAKHEVDTEMPAWLKGGDAPKGKPDKKAVKKHSLKDWFEHMDAKMLAEAEAEKSAFKKPNNPNRTPMDSARALAQKGMAAAKMKPGEKIAEVGATARKIIPGLGKMQAKVAAGKHRADAYDIARTDMNPKDRGPTDPDQEYWHPNSQANREHKRATNFDRIARGDSPFKIAEMETTGGSTQPQKYTTAPSKPGGMDIKDQQGKVVATANNAQAAKAFTDGGIRMTTPDDIQEEGVAEGSGSSSPTRVMKKYLPKGMWDSILSHSGKSKHDNADGSKTSNVWRLRNLTRSWQGQEFDAWKKAVEQELGNGYKVTSEWPTPSVRHIQMNDISAQQGMAEGGGVDKKAMLNKLLSTHKYEKVLAITKQEDPQLYSSLKSVLGNADKHWRILNKATQKMNTIPLQDNKTLDHLEAVARDNQDMAEFYVHRAMKLLNGSAENNMAEADQPPTDSLMSPMSEARAKADEKKKCPPMSHIKKMCQDGKTVAEICKMHPDCNQKELKQMVADCKSKLEEGAKPDFLDLDKDGNKKEPMKKAAKDKNKTVKEDAKPDFLDLDKDGNKKEPMKKAAADKGGDKKVGKKGMSAAQEKFFGKKKTVKEGAEHNHQAAHSEGKAHGLRGHSHCGNNYEDMEEARCYHEGFKEGLDEKHGHQYLDEEEIPMVAGPGNMFDEEEMYEEDNPFFMADPRTPIGGLEAPFSSHVDEMMNTIAFESLDRQLNALLDEGMTVSISKGQQGSPDSVSVTASDADSDKLLALVKQAGLGLFGGDEATMHPGATGSNMPSQSAPGSDIAVVDDHDDMMSLIKKVTDGHDDHGHEAGEETCESCGGMMEEGHSCREAVDEEETEDQMTDEVAEETNPSDNDEPAEEETDATRDAALATAAGKNFADTDSPLEEEGMDSVENTPNNDGMNSVERGEDEYADEEDLEESLANGADDTFESDIDFMTKVISGGLNGQKSTGQSTIPVVASQESRLGNPMRESTDLLKDWKKLAGM